MQTARRDGLEAEINVIPMIDVLLVLLVIFMLIPKDRSFFRVYVPPPEPRRSLPNATPQIVLELRPDGSYAINGMVVPAHQLEARLAGVYTGRAAKLLFIRAAKSRRYREVIHAADVARGAGVEVIAYMP
jgi:biopolymer transport protein TolR